MNYPEQLFTQQELLQLQFQLRRQLLDTTKLPLIIGVTLLCVLTLVFVAFIEWEIIYQIFNYLIGEVENSWNPALMACTGIIMMIGFHLQSKDRPNSFATRFVEKAASVLIPVYLIGLGLFAASVLYKDGLSEMVTPKVQAVIGQISQVADNGVIDSIFAHVTNPLAVLAFSLGIGSLAIINIFVASKLLKMVITNLNGIFTKMHRAKEAIKDHKIIQRSQEQYADISLEENELLMHDDNYIALSIAGAVLIAISSALLPHKKWLKDNEYGLPRTRFETDETVDAKRVAKDVTKIASISQKEILNALKPYILENKT